MPRNLTKRFALVLAIAMACAPIMALAALPFSRSTTYVAGSPPPIKAQDLNDMQDYIGYVYSGTRSLKALAVDGAGNLAASPQGGTVLAARSAAQTAFPTSAPMLAGELNKESVPIGMAHLSGSCSVYGVANVADITSPTSGVCVVTFGFVPPGNDANRALVQVTEQNNLNYTCRPTVVTVDGSNRLKVTVGCQDSTGSLQQSAFYISAYSL